MRIIFSDATALTVQSVTNEGDYLSIRTISATPEQLRTMFQDTYKTKRIIVEEMGKQTVYEGFTTYYRSEEYSGKIYGIVMYRPEKTPEAQAEVAAIGTSAYMGEVNWAMVGSTAALAAIVSVVTSIAGIPEVEDECAQY